MEELPRSARPPGQGGARVVVAADPATFTLWHTTKVVSVSKCGNTFNTHSPQITDIDNIIIIN